MCPLEIRTNRWICPPPTQDNAGVLSTTVLDDKVPSEEILGRMDLVLSAHELVRASFGDESNAGPLSILDIEVRKRIMTHYLPRSCSGRKPLACPFPAPKHFLPGCY